MQKHIIVKTPLRVSLLGGGADFESFIENGIFHKETAKSFRENILSKGNLRNPMTLYTQFKGREPKVNALLKRDGLI